MSTIINLISSSGFNAIGLTRDEKIGKLIETVLSSVEEAPVGDM